MSDDVDISVIVPAYEAAGFLAGALESVAEQVRPAFEVIVVDDGSADATCELVELIAESHPDMRLRLLRQPHRGPGAARNTGIWEAKSDWIAFLDADDLWHPEKLLAITTAIGAHPMANFFCHNEVHMLADGSESVSDYGAKYENTEPLPKQLCRRNLFSTSAVVCRRSLALQYGGFDEGLSSAQDYEFWLRMSPGIVPVFVGDVLGTYVVRVGSISTTRFWRRLGNTVRVKFRHRKKDAFGLYGYHLLRAIASLVVASSGSRNKD